MKITVLTLILLVVIAAMVFAAIEYWIFRTPDIEISAGATRAEVADLGGGAGIDHSMKQTSGEIRILENGHWRVARPFQKRVVEYPGIGSVSTFTLGHSEPITFPRCFSEIQNSVDVMDLPSSVISSLRLIAGKVIRPR